MENRNKRGILGIVPKDRSYKDSKIYNDLKNIEGIKIDMVKGIIFLSADYVEARDVAQKYLDDNKEEFEYTK